MSSFEAPALRAQRRHRPIRPSPLDSPSPENREKVVPNRPGPALPALRRPRVPDLETASRPRSAPPRPARRRPASGEGQARGRSRAQPPRRSSPHTLCSSRLPERSQEGEAAGRRAGSAHSARRPSPSGGQHSTGLCHGLCRPGRLTRMIGLAGSGLRPLGGGVRSLVGWTSRRAVFAAAGAGRACCSPEVPAMSPAAGRSPAISACGGGDLE